MIDIPVHTTERLVLRAFVDGDLAGIGEMYADPCTARYIGGLKDAAESWRAMATMLGHWPLRGYGPYAIEHRTTGDFVGWVGPWFPHGKPASDMCWAIRRDYRGRGFASEAARCALTWVQRDLGWPTVQSLILTGNLPSERVAQKLGAVVEQEIEFRGLPVRYWRHLGSQSNSSNIQRNGVSKWQ
ncbi:MAG: GNAT family N-acetyltransferase [Pseudomonadota bacterium]